MSRNGSPGNAGWRVATLACALVGALLAACGALPSPPAADGGKPSLTAEATTVLATRGDARRGEVAFEVCQGCHRKGALGRADGSYPRLAGQHRSVLIKQMTDVRAGKRRNDKMLPFADEHVVQPADIADIAEYLSQLPSPPDNGRGPGVGLERAAATYRERCADCHGAAGEGDAARFQPRLAGQHERYLARELLDIRDGRRGNADARMVEVVKGLGDAELRSLADWVSRLPGGATR